jgi:hypothetical protein
MSRPTVAHFQFVDRLAVTFCAAGWVWLGVRVARATFASPGSTLSVFAAFYVAYFAADLVSGVVHLVADHVGDATRGWFGRKILAPFRHHHAEPQAIVAHDFAETNGDSCLASLLVLGPTLLFADPSASFAGLVVSAFSLSFVIWVVFTNQIHLWAHAEVAPRPVRWLQRRGWILAPEHHARHHVAPFACHYCITSGQSSWLVDRWVAPHVHKLSSRA